MARYLAYFVTSGNEVDENFGIGDLNEAQRWSLGPILPYTGVSLLFLLRAARIRRDKITRLVMWDLVCNSDSSRINQRGRALIIDI